MSISAPDLTDEEFRAVILSIELSVGLLVAENPRNPNNNKIYKALVSAYWKFCWKSKEKEQNRLLH
jgi:hypothetical protein